MTVSALYEPDVYNGDGSLDTFPVTFDFLNDSTYLKVSLQDETALTYTLCYEHLQYEMSGSNVVFQTGYIPTANDIVIIEFNSDWLQSSDYVENSALPAENMEDDFDKLKLEVQALRDLTARALRVGPEVDLDLVDPRDYFDVAYVPEIEALTEVSAELLTLAAEESELTALVAVDDDLLDIAANWTPASASGAASLRFKEDSDNGTSGVYIKGPASLSGDVTLTLPDSDGDVDQYLKTDGSGNMSWATVDASAAPGGAGNDTQVIINKAGDLYSDAAFHVLSSGDSAGIGAVYSTSYHGSTNVTIGYPSGSTAPQTGVINLYNSTHTKYGTIGVSNSASSANVAFNLPNNNGFFQGILCHDYNTPYWSTAANLWTFIINEATFINLPSTSYPTRYYFHEVTSSGTNKITMQSPDALSADYTLVLPTTDGDANQVMISNGSGILSWSAVTDLVSAASDTVAGKIEIAVQSEMEAGSDNTRAVSPAVQQYHPSASKAWFYSADMSAATISIDKSYNITSVTDNGTGDYTITIATDFSSTAFAVVATASTTAGAPLIVGSVIVDASNVRIRVTDHAGSATDANVLSVIMFGDQ